MSVDALPEQPVEVALVASSGRPNHRSLARRWLLGAALLVSLILVGLVLSFVVQARGEVLKDAGREAGVLTQQLAQDAERIFFEADTQFVTLEDWLHQHGALGAGAFEDLAVQASTHEWLKDAVMRSTSLGGMFLLSADGRRVASSRLYPTPQTDLSDRDYFKTALSTAGRTLVIGPAVKNRQSGLDTVIVIARLHDSDGRLMGFAAANIPAARFVRAYDQARERGLSVALIRRTGDVVVTGTGLGVSMAASLPERMADLQQAWSRANGANWASYIDEPEEQMVVTQPLLAYPLAVVAQRSLDDILLEWTRVALSSTALLGVALMMLWGVTWLAIRQVGLQDVAEESDLVRAANEALQSKMQELSNAKAGLADLNEALAFRINLKTEQLSFALEQAEQANEAKTRFLSQISHELRTPLNSVLGFAQVLADPLNGPLAATQLEHVRRIESSAEYLLGLINDLLDLSGVEQGAVHLHLEPVNLSRLLHSVIETAEPQGRRMNLRIVLEPIPAKLGVLADPLRLNQVLLNLVTNAIKYNRVGGQVRLRGRLQADDSGQSQVAIEVSDSGVGMSEAQQAQLFEPFNRLGAEFSTIQGTGIGLVIARLLTERMGGRIQVQSVPGEGSTFTVVLPVADVPEAPLISGVAPTQGTSGEGAKTTLTDVPAVLQVLYVEDHPSNVALVEAICKNRPGVALWVARSGQEALSRLADFKPDLLLVDMNLGDMTGIELKLDIDRMAGAESMRVVALSADAMPEQIVVAKAAGFDDYMTKPVRVRELLAQFEITRGGLGKPMS